VFHGPALYLWLMFLDGPMTALAGPAGFWGSLFCKILLDQTLFALLVNSVYALLLGFMEGKQPRDTLAKLHSTLASSMLTSWRFWPMVHLLSFSPLIPINFKILWIDTMEIVWVALLSMITNDEKVAAQPQGQAKVFVEKQVSMEGPDGEGGMYFFPEEDVNPRCVGA